VAPNASSFTERLHYGLYFPACQRSAKNNLSCIGHGSCSCLANARARLRLYRRSLRRRCLIG